MKADLHVHSKYSDGAETMEAVVIKAIEQGVTHLSFVDHDTVADFSMIEQLENKYDIKLIPGIEISAYDFKRERKVHILGYNYSDEASHIKALCDPLLERRDAHTLWQINQIIHSGYSLNVEAMREAAKPSKTLYKQHVMAQLTDAKFSSIAYQTLYKKLFKGSGIASGDITYIDAFEAVKAIVSDDGVAVVAHPGQLDSYELIPELVEVGLKGIELYHPDHTEEDHKKVLELANNHQLIVTGGSDLHGAFGAEIKIGDVISPKNQLLS